MPFGAIWRAAPACANCRANGSSTARNAATRTVRQRLGRLEAEGEMTVGAVLDAPVFPMLDLADRTGRAIFENVLATDPSEETRSLLSGSEDDGQMPC